MDEALKAALLKIHRPRRYGVARWARGGEDAVTRCVTCAVRGNSRDLRRADWPCETARALGVTDPA